VNTYYRANCSNTSSLLTCHPTDLQDWLLKTALDHGNNFKKQFRKEVDGDYPRLTPFWGSQREY